MKKVFIIGSVAFLTHSLTIDVSGQPAAAQKNWPQWRGPLASGTAPEADPPLTWGETKNVKWKVKVPGAGSGTPIIWDNRVFVLTAIPTGRKVEVAAAPSPAASTNAAAPGGARPGGGGGGRSQKPDEFYQFSVLCLDRSTGKTLWQKVACEQVPHEGHHGDASFASASPFTDGKHLYAYFGSRGLYCYDLEGNLKWEKDLGDMQARNSFGEGCTPALHGDTIVVLWDHEGEDFIAALDKNTGKELWRKPRNEGTTWATPLIVEHQGKAQVIATATSKVRSYDLATGALIWEGPGLTPNVIPSCVAADGIVYPISGFRGYMMYALKLGQTGEVAESDSNAVLWTYKKNTPYVPSPLLFDGLLYFNKDNNGLLTCLDAKTGIPHFEAERLEGIRNMYASPVGAKDRVYVLGREGACLVLKKGTKLEILATNKLDDGTDASPALAGKEMFIRGRQNLYCIAEM